MSRHIDSVPKRSALLAVGQSAVKGSQVVITVVLARLLSPAEWSSAALVLSIYLVALTVGTLHVQHGIVFFLRGLQIDQRRRFVVRISWALAGAGAVLGGAMMISRAWISSGDLEVSRHLPWIALAVILELPTSIAASTLIALERVAAAAMWDTLTAVVGFAGSVVPVVAGLGVHGLAVGIAAAAAVRAVLFVAVVRSVSSGARELPSGLVRRVAMYGLPLGITLAVSVLNRTLDKWLVAAFDGSNLGSYVVAAQEIPLLAVLPVAGGAAIVAQLVDGFRHGDRRSAHAEWIRLTATMSMVVVPLAIGLVLIAPELFELLLPQHRRNGVLPFQLFSLIALHRVAEYGVVFRAADRTADLMASAAVLLVSNLVCAGVGVVLFGAPGASAGTLVANVIAWVFVLRRISSVFGCSIRQAIAWEEWVRAVATATIAATAAFALGSFTAATPARLIVKLLTMSVGYLLLLQIGRPGRPRRTASSVESPAPMAVHR